MLGKLTDSDRTKLATNLVEKHYGINHVIFNQGDDGYGFYIVISGKIQVSVDNQPIAQLSAGDYFGEQALISNQPRNASCISITHNTRLFYLSRDLFHSLFGYNKLAINFVKRAAISAESTQSQQYKQSTVIPCNSTNRTKTTQQIQCILSAMNNNILFMNVDSPHKQLLVNEMHEVRYTPGSIVIKQGDYGDNLYIVDNGIFDIIVNDKKVATRTSGTCFGELALMYNAKRAATVISTTQSTAWTIDRFTYRHIITDMSEHQYMTYCQFLKRVDLFRSLAEYERHKIADALDEIPYKANTVIFNQGTHGDTMYIIYSGTVKIQKTSSGDKSETVQVLSSGNVFGERALHTNELRAATAITVSDTVLLRLDRAAFVLLLGPLESLLQQKVNDYISDDIKRQSNKIIITDGSNSNQSKLPINQSVVPSTAAAAAVSPNFSYTLPPRHTLKVIGTLGKGSFGFVQLVQDPITKQTYALKAVNKQQIVQTGQQHHVISEKNSMLQFSHPFLIQLYGTYKDTNRLYFLLEPVLGGELFTVLREYTLFTESMARFYAAQIVLSFEYMHTQHNIVYRDLKPENLLLDQYGYLKITDFGFAKKVLPGTRTWTLCGTPDYLAPEIVSGKGHGHGVDWWTLGIFIYEMLASYPPFYDDDPMKTYNKIMQGNIVYPNHFSSDVVDLISKLLQPRVSQRLGMLSGEVNDIKSHPWFHSINFDDVYNKRVQAPIIPKIKSLTDISNFENYGNTQQKILNYVDDGSKWDAEF